MIKIILSCLLLLMGVNAYAQDGGEGVGGGTGVSGQRLPKGCTIGIVTDARGVASCSVTPTTATPEAVINITDYGAVCDGVTDDTVAINAAFAAARSSPIYTNGGAVNVVGVADATHSACAVHSVNATAFTQQFGGEQLVVSNLSLLCSGAGNICLDFTASLYYHLRNVEITGSDTDPPEVGLQIGGTITGVLSCCIATVTNLQTFGTFTLAALYNGSAESMTFFGSRIRNNGSETAPIRYLTVATPGSGYTDGFYTRVPVTGGSGSGAVAYVRVLGGVVTIIDVGDSPDNSQVACAGCYQGRSYTVGDTVSVDAADIGGTGSGFTATVSSVAGYAVIQDGVNHWRQTSAYQTVDNPVDIYRSFTYNSFFGGAMVIAGSATNLAAALWVSGPRSFLLDNVYLLTFNSPTWCVELFDLGINIDQTYRSGCEVGGTVHSAFHVTGPNRSPEMVQFTMTSAANMASVPYIFSTGPTITNVLLRNADIKLSIANGSTFFEHPQLFDVSGSVAINRAEIWNAPLSFSGTLCVGGPPEDGIHFTQTRGVCASPNGASPNLGPLEIQNDPVAAWSCSRRLISTFTGPLCQLERVSDSVKADIFADSLGNFNLSAASTFCAGTTCTVRTMYDQSGNANNAVQTTEANQPAFVLTDPQINNRSAVLFGDLSNKALVVTSSATIDDIFAAGGYINMAYSRVGSGQLDRLLYKASAAWPATGVGWEWRNATPFNGHLAFIQLASTTDGDWETADGIGFLHGRLYEIQYNSSSVTNVPTIGVDGTAATLSTSDQPVGTISTDAGTNMIVGNNAALTRGADGAFAEILIYKSIPNAQRLEAIRRNQAIYYGMGNIID